MADDTIPPLIPSTDETISDVTGRLDALETSLADPVLFGDSSAADLVVSPTPMTYPLGRSWRFDFLTGRFVGARTARTPDTTRGVEQLQQWIEKCLRTFRGAHPIHSDEYGLEQGFREVGELLSDVQAGDLIQRISDALRFHPKIIRIQAPTLGPDPDDPEALQIFFQVVLDDSSTMDVQVTL